MEIRRQSFGFAEKTRRGHDRDSSDGGLKLMSAHIHLTTRPCSGHTWHSMPAASFFIAVPAAAAAVDVESGRVGGMACLS